MIERKLKASVDLGWLQIAEFTEEKLRLARLRAGQLEALAGVFRGMAATGDPCPAELVEATIKEKDQKTAQN